MACIGKFLTSALAVHIEVQASLAAVNFDFAFLKVEAPAKYAGVGNGIRSYGSEMRRTDLATLQQEN